MPVTIKDVAKRAGVAIGTVSRALNNYKDISPETRNKIFKAINELGYTPHVIARSLSSKVCSNIGVIISGLLEGHRQDNLWYLLLQGIYRFAVEKDLEVAIYGTDSSKQQRKAYKQFCQERNIAGAVLIGIKTTDAYFREMVDSEIPCVLVDVPFVSYKVGCVSIDNEKASREIVEYVIVQNHRNIVVIAGKKTAAVTAERAAGIIKGVIGRGLELPDSNFFYCDFSQEKAYETAKKYILENGTKGATAFICMSDIMAIGVINAIKDAGYRVPDDFSVVGFDDNPIAEICQPGLTTIRQDFSRIGYNASALLKKIIDNEDAADHILLPYELVIRESVRKI